MSDDKKNNLKLIGKNEEVLKVKSKNINQKHQNKALEYLAIKFSLISNSHFEIKIFSLEVVLLQ